MHFYNLQYSMQADPKVRRLNARLKVIDTFPWISITSGSLFEELDLRCRCVNVNHSPPPPMTPSAATLGVSGWKPQLLFPLPDLPFYAIETSRHSISVEPILGLCVGIDRPRL